MKALVFGARREGYGIDQISNPVTVGQLREMLEGIEDDVAIILGHDNEYTYGTLSREAELREERDGEVFRHTGYEVLLDGQWRWEMASTTTGEVEYF